MRSIITAIIAITVLVSCENSGKRDTSFLQESVGNINSLLIIAPNDLWNGGVGEEIRSHFAAPAIGLPQQEPLFSMNQMQPSTFTGFARKNRTFLQVSLGDKDSVFLGSNPYAKPQTGAFIQADSEERLVELIRENNQKIIAAFKNTEIKEKQRRIRISLLKIDSLKERFGLAMNISSAYRIALSSDEFYWLRKDLKSGSTNIIVYQVPLDMIGSDSTIVGDIVKIRDSIAGSLLPVEDEGRFITEPAFSPYLFSTEIDGKFAYETRGIWEVKDQYMAGPFLNYAVRDEANNRYLIMEGFTYAPSVEKRNLQFELEAVLRSAKIE